MDRVREAALARAQAAPKPVVEPNQVKDAVKAFNAAVLKVPDYRHIHCSQILDALQILDKILKDLAAFGGKSPKDPSKKMSVKTSVLRKKTHDIESASIALLLLGFKEEVVDLEKSLVYHGKFPEQEQAQEYLALCTERLQTTLRDVQRHAESSAGSKSSKQSKEQAIRAAAMAQYEEDRMRQRERVIRERRQRGDTVAAEPLKDRSQDKRVRRPPVAVGGRGVRLSDLEGVNADEAEEAPEDTAADEVENNDEENEVMEQGSEEEQVESEDDDAQADGLRRRFPGTGNRLGGGENDA